MRMDLSDHALRQRPGAILATALADGAPAPHELWQAWAWDPLLLAGLALAAWAYGRGVCALWSRAGAGRGIARWQAAAFGAGLVALAVALVSPLEGLAAALFSGHMAQHLVLILVAAPLLVLGEPLVAYLWALPPARRRTVGAWLRRAPLRAVRRALALPGAAWLLHIVAVWAWHLPGLYQAALVSEPLHSLEHGSFLATALLFWGVVVRPGGGRRLGYGAGILYILATALPSALLGALITLAPSPWYPAYAASAPAWGLTPLEDQQLAGLLMWIPPGILYVGVAAALLAAWLREVERRVRRREERGLARLAFEAGSVEGLDSRR